MKLYIRLLSLLLLLLSVILVSIIIIIIIIIKGSKSRGGDITPNIFFSHIPANQSKAAGLDKNQALHAKRGNVISVLLAFIFRVSVYLSSITFGIL